MKKNIKKIKDRTASFQTKNLNIRVNPNLYNVLETMAKDNDMTISDVVRSTLNERLMQGRKFRKEN